MTFISMNFSTDGFQDSVLELHVYHEVCCDASNDGEQERLIKIKETKCIEFHLALKHLLGE
jgi:hypothetical protein